MKNKNVLMGMDITKEVTKMINEKEIVVISGMSENEVKAYKLGVKNTLSALSGLFNGFSDYVIVNTNVPYARELSGEDLLKIMED